MSASITVSIICPCYKSEKFLPNIISDVIAQTYQNWELILVSNGEGQERQVKVIQPFLEKDSRIRLIQDPVGGVSRARNKGIDAAQGDWITFVDADDRIEPEHIQNYMDVVDDESELVVMGFKEIKRGIETITSIAAEDSKKEGMEKILNHLLHYWEGILGFPVNKLFNRGMLNNRHNQFIRFDDSLSYLEDQVFCLNYLACCSRVQTIDKFSYIYVINNSSANSKYHSCLEKSNALAEKGYDQLYCRTDLDENFIKKARTTMAYIHKYMLALNQYKKGCDLSTKSKVSNLKRWLFNNEFKDTQKEYSKDSGNWATRLFDMGIKINSPWFMHFYLLFLTKSRNALRFFTE